MEERLAQIAEMVENGSRVADIGTDHAYLPIELVRSKKIDFAIASDVAKGPLQNAKNDIIQAGLSDKIDTRLGSGLVTINSEDNIDTIVIAGMGGKLMRDLLQEAKESQTFYSTLILEPNVGEPIVRKWLADNSYKIVEEKIIEVSGHIYELIKAKRVSKVVSLTKLEVLFGPILIKEKNSVFIKKWQNQLKYQVKLVENLNRAKVKDETKIAQAQELIKMIKEVIN